VIEPNLTNCVKRSMAGFKSILTSLLPVFWLMVLVLYPVASPGQFAPKLCCSPLSLEEATVPMPAKPCCWQYSEAQCQWLQSSSDRLEATSKLFESVASRTEIHLGSGLRASPTTDDAFLLPQRWQFVWRAAAQPRAPSLLT
jgi:hypothetical protein